MTNTNDSTRYDCSGPWESEPASYACHVALIREPEGDYSALVLNLPGAGSCGDTEEEAIARAREAASAVIASYLLDGEEIPWEHLYEIPPGSKHWWLVVKC